MPSGPRSDDAARLFAHPGVDWPTVGLCALMWGGLAANLAWAAGALSAAPPPIWATVLIGTFFLNMTFTVWHEGAHGTAFRSRAANDVLGVLGAFPAFIPYFMIRRDHHLHHEHANDREKDPDAWFLEGSIWTLPLRYPRGVARAGRLVRRTSPPAWERRADRALLLVQLALLALAAAGGWLLPVVWAWIVPKGLAMWIHAWYVNWLPHRALPAERYRDTRIFPIGLLTPLMLCHNYHGVHHAWQTVPWHRYPAVFRAKREFLEKRGVPVREVLSTR